MRHLNAQSRSSGKERDSETGLDYFSARYYGSNMGRWLSPDWSAGPTAVPYADFSNPQSLNLYGYVGNNPLNRAGCPTLLHLFFWVIRNCLCPSIRAKALSRDT